MFSKSIVIFMLIFKSVVDFILYFVPFLKLFQISLSAKYTDSMCLAPARFLCQSAGDCTQSIALQLHATFSWKNLLIGLFISWVVKLFSSVKIHKIQRIHMLHITVHIYCLITCNIKSLLIVPKISHISRKTCQVSRFLAKSSDSRNKFVFLPKQPPLSELSAPVIPIQWAQMVSILSTNIAQIELVVGLDYIFLTISILKFALT